MRRSFVTVGCLIISSGIALNCLADDHSWRQVTGAETLRTFMSDVHIEADFGDGAKSIATYRADGTGYLEAWNGRFNRTWSIRGDEQICVQARGKGKCFRIEENTAEPDSYRIIDDENRTTRVNRMPATGNGVFIPYDPTAAAKNQVGRPSLEEIANEFVNPNTSLTFLATDTDYLRYDGDLPGADTQSRVITIFRPTVPFPIGDPRDNTNFAFRPIVPIFWRADFPNDDGDFDSEGIDLGDISLNPSIRRTFDNGFILGGGGALTVPTATNSDLGLDQFLLGPNIALGLQKRWLTLAATVSTVWDVAGEDDYDTHLSNMRLLYVARLPKGWQVFGNPSIVYDHEANSDNDLSLPISIGIARTRFFRGKPWRFALEYWHYVESPDDFGPDYQIRFTVTPTMQTPWLKRVCDGRLPWC